MKRVIIGVLIMINTITHSYDKELAYQIISQEKAKEMMEENNNYIILDVRTDWEYKMGHIAGAINIPNEEIGHQEIEELPDKNQPILVYCRSGHRSKQASSKLAVLGYKNIYEFGGVITWEYGLVE